MTKGHTDTEEEESTKERWTFRRLS